MNLWSVATIAAMAAVLWLNAIMLATPYVRYVTSVKPKQRALSDLTVSLLLLLILGAYFLIQVGTFAGSGVSGMFDPLFAQLMWAGPLAGFIEFQVAAVVLWTLYAVLRPMKAGYLCYLVFLPALGCSYLAMGHASGMPWWAQIVVFVHVLAALLWIGCLNRLRRLSAAKPVPQVRAVMERFGKHMSLVVPLLLVAGWVYYRRLSGQWLPAYPFGNYELALVIKVGAVGLMLLLAILHKQWLVPRLATRQSTQTLKHTITLEMIVAMIVILLASTLSTSFSPQ